MWNGFANRFLWILARRSKTLPDGGSLSESDLDPFVKAIAEALVFGREVREIKRDDAAKRIWHAVYNELSEGRPGLAGAAISRAEPQVMRLACIYAVLDQSTLVRPEHLLAALAVWDYASESACTIFGDSLGNAVADRILRALRGTPKGLSRSEIRDLFQRHGKKSKISDALDLLEGYGLATRESISTGGRPKTLWFASSPATKARKAIKASRNRQGTEQD